MRESVMFPLRIHAAGSTFFLVGKEHPCEFDAWIHDAREKI